MSQIFFSCPIYIQVQLWIQANHGAPGNSKGKRHVGDLGNIQAENGKEASIDITDSIISLWGERSIIGRAIVVHEGPDDLGLGGDEGSITTGKVIIYKSRSGVSLVEQETIENVSLAFLNIKKKFKKKN